MTSTTFTERSAHDTPLRDISRTEVPMRWFALVIIFFVMHARMTGQWSYDPKIGTPICTTSPSQMFPRVLSDSSGGAFIAWQSSPGNMEAQRIDSLGTGHWGVQGRVVVTSVPTLEPMRMVSSSPRGSLFISAWRQWMWGGPSGFPPVQHVVMKLDVDGHTTWPDSGIAVTNYFQLAPVGRFAMQPDDQGGVFYAYTRYDSLYVGRIDSAGVLLWGQTGQFIDGGTSNRVHDVALVSDAEGGLYCVYSKWVYAGGSRGVGVFVQRIDSTGTQQWPPSVVVQSPVLAVNSMNSVFAIGDGRGGVVVATSGYDPFIADSTFTQDIYAQRISATRQLLWGSAGRVVVQDSADQMLEALVEDGSNGAYFIFTGKNVSSGRTDRDILAQRLDSAGISIFTARGLTACGNAAEQMRPTAAPDGVGGIVLAWEDLRDSTASDRDIYAQRIDATGALLWGGVEGVPVSTAPNAQRRPSITSDGLDGAIVVWEDARNVRDIPDIYAARVTSNGVLLPVTFTALTASMSTEGVEVSWTTMHESAIHGFSVERSGDGRQWEVRGFTPARQSDEGAAYVYHDIISHVLSPRIWYRVRVENTDGTTEYSPVTHVDVNHQPTRHPGISLYPEPVRAGQSLNVVLRERNDEMVAIHVHDLLGREIPTLRRIVKNDAYGITLPLTMQQLPAGCYMLSVSTGTETKTALFRIID